MNAASNSRLPAGSCTTEIQTSEEFEVEGKRIVLVDTLGFDNTKRSDVEVLKPVAAFLEEL